MLLLNTNRKSHMEFHCSIRFDKVKSVSHIFEALYVI